MKHYTHINSGTCSSKVDFDIDENGKLHNVKFTNGCAGNLLAISKLVEGKDAREVMEILKGNKCGDRPTSCADQFSLGIEAALGSRN
ncbi:MAG: TIGR03905 family TSCPD domain-containing protein [Oscillospiraceae bacterium]|jgi:uncharacterized protein (TIGR03905 family)